MNLPTEIFGNVVVIHSPEELGAEQAAMFQSCLSRQELHNIVLDLDNTESLDSVGLTALLDVQDQPARTKRRFEDRHHQQHQSQNSGSHPARRQLEVFDSVIDAVKSFR